MRQVQQALNSMESDHENNSGPAEDQNKKL